MRANESLIQLRPDVHREAMESSPIEKFQNEVLRPILKFQHELFQEEWRHNPIFEKVKELKQPEEKRRLLSTLFSKNPALLQRFIGTAVGLLTTKEYAYYLLEKGVIDKRIKELLLTRLLSY